MSDAKYRCHPVAKYGIVAIRQVISGSSYFTNNEVMYDRLAAFGLSDIPESNFER